MSQKRSGAIRDFETDHRSSITTLSRDYAAGRAIPLHFHDRHQLVYATRGVMTVRAGKDAWVVPTHRAVWIPAGVPHTITMSGRVAMRTLYFRPRLSGSFPRDCCVMNVQPLLKELVLHACTYANLRKNSKKQLHLICMILDQLEEIDMVALKLSNPTDVRAMRIVEILEKNPADRRPLGKLCRLAGASKRTIERLFQDEVGMTFGKWRQQLRLMHAMRLLVEGAKVTYAALESGYSTPSAFISMFRKTLGTTPTAYFRSESS